MNINFFPLKFWYNELKLYLPIQYSFALFPQFLGFPILHASIDSLAQHRAASIYMECIFDASQLRRHRVRVEPHDAHAIISLRMSSTWSPLLVATILYSTKPMLPQETAMPRRKYDGNTPHLGGRCRDHTNTVTQAHSLFLTIVHGVYIRFQKGDLHSPYCFPRTALIHAQSRALGHTDFHFVMRLPPPFAQTC